MRSSGCPPQEQLARPVPLAKSDVRGRPAIRGRAIGERAVIADGSEFECRHLVLSTVSPRRLIRATAPATQSVQSEPGSRSPG